MINSFDGKTLFGLSTDTKPTTLAQFNNLGYWCLRSVSLTGLPFIEIDTGKLYFFDAANATWREWGA